MLNAIVSDQICSVSHNSMTSFLMCDGLIYPLPFRYGIWTNLGAKSRQMIQECMLNNYHRQ